MAERAAWLGNDETHYQRKWTDKDISDLKTVISLAEHWIDISMETDKCLSEIKNNRRPARELAALGTCCIASELATRHVRSASG